MSGLSSLDYINFVYIANQDNYFTTPSYWYWTMTPFAYEDGRARVGFVYIDGSINNFNVNTNLAVRPVVSLKSDAIGGGNGTSSNPFYVDEKP